MNDPDNSYTLELRTAMNKDIWNAAIEAAANKAEANGAICVAMEIRKLKK